MSKKLLISLGIAFVVSIIVFTLIATWVGYSNRHNELHIACGSQETKLTNFYDRMWKTLQTEASISNKYADDFKSIYIPLMEKRYGGEGDGSLMKWVQERNPVFDNSMYKKLMTSVESLRAEFYNENNKLVSIKQEHDMLVVKIPSRFFVDNTLMEIKTITSAQSKEVARTGEENDVELFK